METRIRLLLLSVAAAVACGGCAARAPARATATRGTPVSATRADTGANADAGVDAGADQADAAPPVIIQPQVQRRTITVPKIRSENVELGAYYGELSIQDFGTEPVVGVRLDYHVTEGFFFEASAGRANGGKTSYELLSGGVQLLSDAERRFTYYNLSLGYNLLPGEIFIGREHAMTSALYAIGGIGSVKFAGQQNFTVNFGAGFRVLPTDWLALHLDVQDLVFRSNVFSVYRLTNNLQATLGASVFF